MIISQMLEQSDSHRSAYLPDTMPSPISLTASIPSVGHSSISGATQGVYPPTDSYFIPNRVQSDLPSMNMYVAQPESTSISSPGNFAPNSGTVASAPGLMGSHYAAGLQHPPGYPPLGEDYEVRSGVGGVWPGSYTQAPYPYENTFGSQYPYDRYCGVDINDGVRRKNATRESTNTLKAWLQEHKKNPYPTKGEKIMLAIITKMTLTQVSTWFANARRRLKKENKMTWVPKNRSSDSTNPGSKKTDDEDDDDVTSHLSQENECKSDIDQAIDSDDSDARKVTSTNINDDITTTTDLKESSNEFQNERLSVTSDGTTHHLEEHEYQPNDEHIRGNIAPYNHKDKSWSSVNKETDSKQAETINSNGVSPPYSNNACFSGPTIGIQQSSSLVNSSIAISEGICPPNDVKYQPQWTSNAYSAYSSEANVDNPRLLPSRTTEPLESSHGHSPIQGNEIKPNIPRDSFGMNGATDPCSTSPIAPSYAHSFQQSLPQSNDYYRSVDRLNVDMNPSYYPHNDLRPEVKPERLQATTYPRNQDHIPPTTPKFSLIPSPSHSSSESASSNAKPLHQHNLSPQYYPNVKLSKPVAPATTSYAPSYFQQESFNQLTPPSANIEYGQRKGFFNSEASNFHMPSSNSPRK